MKVRIFYNEKMAPTDAKGNFSKSPSKPRRFVEFLRTTPLWKHVEIVSAFKPVTPEMLRSAHTKAYVDSFLAGDGDLCESNGLRWSPEFRDSVLLTNGSLVAALREAIANRSVTMAPVSGFHHATPSRGGGFCTFSGQVIAALYVYHMAGLRGAWIDLDGHFGNSIEDSRKAIPELNNAIPVGFNINPIGTHENYLADLTRQIKMLDAAISAGKIDYVCFAHGADSHEWDDLGEQCTTAEWLEASRIVYDMLANHSDLPVTLALFGGYRDDHPESVLGLHAMDLGICLRTLFGHSISYDAEVRKPLMRSRVVAHG
jgi:acetoin utilization deacetylase AcuC-like enzyme